MLAGFRVGPYEIAASAAIPGPWPWYVAKRVAAVRRLPPEAFVAISLDDAPALQAGFEVLRKLEDARIPDAIAFYEGLGAMVVAAPTGIFLDELVIHRRAERVSMSPATLLDVGLELADVLCHAHRRGVYHGGLWPGRVAVGLDGGLTVWGFEDPHPTPPPAWLAPDASRGPSVGAWTDQWSLAAILGALVSGSPPWTDQGDLGGWLAPLELQWPALARAIRRAMSPDPQDRYPAMEGFREELLGLSRKAGGASERAHLGRRLVAAMSKSEPDPLRTEEIPASRPVDPSAVLDEAPPVRARPRARALIPTDEPVEAAESDPTEQIVLDSPSLPDEPSMKYPTRPTLRLAEPSPFADAPSDADESPVEPAALKAAAIRPSDETPDAVTPRFAIPRAHPTLEPPAGMRAPTPAPVPRIAMPTISLGPVPPPRADDLPSTPDVTQEEEILLSRIDLVDEPYQYPNPTVVPVEEEPSDPGVTSFELGLDEAPRIDEGEEELELRIPPRRVEPITQIAPYAAGFMLMGMFMLTVWNVTH